MRLPFLLVLATAAHAFAQPGEKLAESVRDAMQMEAPFLTEHRQVTSRDAFVKAGESYFNADGTWVIFQAIGVPAGGTSPESFYGMYVAPVSGASLGAPILVSPPGSANTCGWFHPKHSEVVLFGSTLTPPKDDQKSGFQVGTRKYVWMFPAEMEVATRTVPQIRDTAHASAELQPVFSRPNYDAECSFSPDGRFILYAHVQDRPANLAPDAPHKADADIFIYDTQTKVHTSIVTAKGYDGGPFFSPDGKQICYRSDRRGDDLLQIFAADLAFNEDGVPTGILREYQLTDNEHVNWCPFYHPSGKFLVYASSQAGHDNYEVFALELDPQKLKVAAASTAPGASVKVSGLRVTRVTHAPGADVLPAFSADGKTMIWTSQRGPALPSEPKPSSQLWMARVNGTPFDAKTEPTR